MEVPMLDEAEWKLVVTADKKVWKRLKRYPRAQAVLWDEDLEALRAAHEEAQENLKAHRESNPTSSDEESELVSAARWAAREYRWWRERGPMLREYKRITGFRETVPNAVAHHRVSMYGPPCNACGKPLRTPRAKFCAGCPD